MNYMILYLYDIIILQDQPGGVLPVNVIIYLDQLWTV